MSWPDIYQLVNTVGLPLVILGVMTTALWRVAIWAEKTVVTPVLENHLKFLATMSVRLEEHSDRLRSIEESARKQVATDEMLCRTMADQTTILKYAIESQTHTLMRMNKKETGPENPPERHPRKP